MLQAGNSWRDVTSRARLRASGEIQELRSILKLPDVQEKLASDGNDFGANTPQSLLAFIKNETEKYRVAVKVSGAKLD